MGAQRAELARSRVEWARQRSTQSSDLARLMAGFSEQTATRRARANEEHAARRREVEGLMTSIKADLTVSRARWAEEARARKQDVAEFMAGLPMAQLAAMRRSGAFSPGDLRARRARGQGRARREG